MGSRPYRASKDQREANRKQRKARWILMKNRMRQYPICNYDNLFYCNHEYDEERGWVWVDFSFYHTKLKKYFAVAMTTLEYKLYGENEDKAREAIDLTHPYDGPGMVFLPIDKKTQTGRIEFTDRWRAVYNERKPLEAAMLLELNSKAEKVSPYVDVKDYGDVAVGLWVSLNTSRITPHTIKEFITFYRSIGEPTTPGRVWTGEEVEVVPARIEEWHA